MNKFAEHVKKEMLKSAKVSKKADIDQRLSYGHFIKQEDENKLPKFNTLEDIKKYIKSTNRFPDNFFYKGGLFTEDEYDLDGMYVTYGSPEIDKAIVINTPNNRYNHKGNYKNLDIEIKEEDSPDFRTDINYTLPIKVYEKYFPKKQSSKANKMAKKAFTYKDEKAALAKFLNIKEEDLTKNEDSFHFGIPEFTTKSGEQYSVSASESAIKDAVAENMENLFDELGFEEFKEKVLPHVGGFENNFSVSESHFYDEVYRELEEDGIEEPTDEQIEKRQQEIIDNYGSAEEFFIEFGDEYVKQMIDHGDAYMNFETMAENVIDQYGAGHELSSYDNSTEEIEYNGKTYYIFRQAKINNKMNKKAKTNKLAEIINREIRKSAIAENDYFDIIEVDENDETIDLIESDYTNGIATVIEKAKEIANNEGKHIIVVNRFTEEDEDGNEYVNDDLNEIVWDSEKDVEIERYGVEYRDMNKGYYNIVITDTEEKAKEILEIYEKIENMEEESSDVTEFDFLFNNANELANDSIEEIDTNKIERLKGIYKGIKIINYNKNIPQLWLY